jgi:hypothetical protein
MTKPERNSEQRKARNREYKLLHREEIRARGKRYREKHAEKVRAYRKAYDQSQSGAEKRKAQSVFLWAVEIGAIIRPDKCSKCGVRCKPHGHHEDYTKPLEVVWLCASCHQRRHAELAVQR